MPIDARLRERLQRSMSEIDTDAERFLDDARRRGHRRLVIRRLVSAAAVAALLVVVAVAAPTVLEIVRDQQHRPSASPSLASISGTYTTTITPKDTSDAGSVGTWLLALDGSGTLDLASLTDGDIGRSVSRYQAINGELFATALTGPTCPGVGRYTWSRSGSSLTFALVSDPCALRAGIISSRPWTSTAVDTGPALPSGPSISDPQSEPILGTWRSAYTCEKVVGALERAGLSGFAPEYLVALKMQEGPADQLSRRTDLCAGARGIQRSLVFQPNGYFMGYQGKELVDYCRCYHLVGSNAYIVVGDPGEPDILLHYRIAGATLAFEAAKPDQCASAKCRDQFAYAVAQYTTASWERVNG